MPLHVATGRPDDQDDQRDHDVVVARLDNGRANAIDLEIVTALADTIDALGPTQALVVTGRPGMFTGGLDLRILARDDDRAVQLLGAMGALLIDVLQAPRPVVVAADGHGVAAGAMLMLAADLAIVSDRPARYGFAEVPSGMPLPTGVIELISARANPAATQRLAAHGLMATPGDVVALGLAHHVVPADDLLDTAVTRAAELAALPPEPYAVTKRRVTAALAERLRTAIP